MSISFRVTGAQGPKGETGATGFSPTIAITDIPGGHRVTITDETGPHSFDVMDGDDASVTVDQAYDATSTNAQSGTAVAEAVADKAAVEINSSTDYMQIIGSGRSAGFNVNTDGDVEMLLADPGVYHKSATVPSKTNVDDALAGKASLTVTPGDDRVDVTQGATGFGLRSENGGVVFDIGGSDVMALQPKLESGTNIKTINQQSLLGSGDLAVGGGVLKTVDKTASGVDRLSYRWTMQEGGMPSAYWTRGRAHIEFEDDNYYYVSVNLVVSDPDKFKQIDGSDPSGPGAFGWIGVTYSQADLTALGLRARQDAPADAWIPIPVRGNVNAAPVQGTTGDEYRFVFTTGMADRRSREISIQLYVVSEQGPVLLTNKGWETFYACYGIPKSIVELIPS